MRIAERHPVIYKIVRCIRGIRKTVSGTGLHNAAIEFRGGKHSGKQGNAALDRKLVLSCIDLNCSLDELPLEVYRAASPAFEADIYDAIRMKNCVEKRNIR